MEAKRASGKNAEEARGPGLSPRSVLRGPIDKNALCDHDSRLARLAPVLNRAFTTSLAVRAVAEMIAHGTVGVGDGDRELSPLNLEALLATIFTLADDLNKDVCQAVDFLDGVCSRS
ncbi:hypothetical protein [Lacisediminimonas profundi]|uniref:hypothetical protein n=1 Tax=Lacisediminimonas profundi TaxID=2603856 RepID=UPI00124B75BF|nr:hypothetical protein [Lacisediminimonas profundi]